MLYTVFIQVEGFEEARKPFGRLGRYGGLINATKKIYIEEGFWGFYKGTLPSILKVIEDIPALFSKQDVF